MNVVLIHSSSFAKLNYLGIQTANSQFRRIMLPRLERRVECKNEESIAKVHNSLIERERFEQSTITVHE